ncbi:MAG: ABC transporter substrate-binding protein [Proteobacteria bacterium]|nr:ABC transporter substrate-binding protein [Pseudomonadota bacterium]NIS67958.1 ABC transporter substrate-binding protein [Pseudomonadota bacterium]
MKNGKSVFGFSLLFYLIVISFVSAQTTEQGVRDSTVTMGILCPLSGPYSSVGANFLDGIQTFLSHVNDIGGIHQRSIVLSPQDDGKDPDQSMTAAQEMLGTGGVFGIISASGIETTQALIDRGIRTEDIPVLVVGAFSKSSLSDIKTNTFTLGMPYRDQIVLAIEYLLKRNPETHFRMGLLFRDSFLGHEVEKGFHGVSNHYGLTVVGEERYGTDTFDFIPSVNRLRSAGSDHVVLGATTWEVIQVMREANGMGWVPQFIGTSANADPDMMVEAGEATDNYLVVDYLAKPWEKLPGVTLMLGNTQKYYPRKNTNALNRHHVLGYVSGLLVVEALRNAGRELTREAFIDALGRIETLNTHGLAGPVLYDRESQLWRPAGRVFHFDWPSGRFLPVTDWAQPLIKVRP